MRGRWLRRAFFGLAALLAVAGALYLHAYGVVRNGSDMAPAAAGAPTPPGLAGKSLRIAILGTSLTVRGTWPDALEAALAGCRTAPVAVERIARAGASSDWGVDALAAALAAGPAPDILVVEFTTNDAALHRGVRLDQSRANHERIIQAAPKSAVFLTTMNPTHGPRGWARPGLAAYERMYRELAAAAGVGLIDIARRWAARDGDARDARIPDGLHPTDAAMREVVAEAVFETLRPLVCDPA